ncbi:MAG TPA: sensor domain-containing diguanylate cyclase, partial [Actinomycetota bacterium]|nr:sensor domain-containing diguanylate cyclase [Actinomycetota bacterium]
MWLLAACMAAAGALAYVAGVLPLHRLPAPIDIPWWVLAIGMGLSESFVVHIPIRGETQSFSLTEMPLVLGLFFTDPAMVVPAYLLGSAFALTVVRRQNPLKLTFNLALVALESSLAVIVFHAIVDTGAPLAWTGWLAAFAAALTQDVVADVAVIGAVSLLEGELTIDWNLLRFGWVVYSANVTLGIAGVLILWTQPGAAWTLFVLGAIPFVAYRSYAALSSEHARLGMLYESTRSLLDGTDLDVGAEGLLSRLMEMFDAERAELVTFGHGGLRAVARRLELGGELTTSEPWNLDLTEGVWGRLLSEQEAVLLPRPIENATLRAHFEANGVRDAMVAPVFGRDTKEVVGTIAVFNRRGDVGTFDRSALRLLETVAHQVSVSLDKSRLIEELRAEAAMRTHQALHDPLTGLPNRTMLLEELDRVLTADAVGRGGSLMLVNVDGFQHVNDTLGHEAGDALLREMAERLRDATNDGDFLARIGGDEFVVLREEDTTTASASKLLADVSAPVRLEGIPVEVTASAGRATWPKDGKVGTRLLRRADVAMRVAKAARSGIEDYREENDAFSEERLRLIGELR